MQGLPPGQNPITISNINTLSAFNEVVRTREFIGSAPLTFCGPGMYVTMMSSSLLLIFVSQGRPPVIRLDLHTCILNFLFFMQILTKIMTAMKIEATRYSYQQLSEPHIYTTWIHAPLSPNHGSTPYVVSRRKKRVCWL